MKKNSSIEKYKVSSLLNIRDSIKRMDEGGIGFMVVVDESDKVIGVFTDGDFRKAILKGISLNDTIIKITNRNYKYLEPGYNKEDAINIFKNSVSQQLPVIQNGNLLDVIIKANLFFDSDNKVERKLLNVPVVIMAGGKGTRLEPFTHILPKPLIPIGEKPILEIIMNEYLKYGINQFYLSVNHMAKMIEAYFEDKSHKYEIKYIREEQPLGTAGSLKYVEGKFNAPFFVSNCDILIKDDYSKLYDFHINGGFVMTLVASMQHHVLPYGVCEIEAGGKLTSIIEKPEYDFLVNTGMYILNPEVLTLIPTGKLFNMTNLINILQEKKYSIGVYPVSEKSYIDIGQWSEYKKTLKTFLE
ncbi:MAG: nucleotidyltransferase family protein [Bacteroidetes bacterium]|nr:nucleotidyltransferase family protein [Bacteroidota bacterium]